MYSVLPRYKVVYKILCKIIIFFFWGGGGVDL